MMKAFCIFLISFYAVTASARTVGYSSSISGARFVRVLNESIEEGLIDMKTFSDWSDIEVLPSEVQSEALNGVSNLPNLSDYYFIIPNNERFKTESGVAYFALAEPLNYNQLEAEILAEEKGEKLEDFLSSDRSNDFRWIIYLQDDGFLKKEQISEAAFQKLITEHGVNVIAPRPYRFNMDRHLTKIAEETKRIRKAESAEVAQIVEMNSESSSELSLDESSNEYGEQQSSQWWLWFVSALVIIGALGLVIRRKN